MAQAEPPMTRRAMRVLFIGKRRSTNQDVLSARFGRMYALPACWHDAGHDVRLVLMDYRGAREETADSGGLPMRSLPAFDPRTAARIFSTAKTLRPDIVVASGDCFVGLLARAVAARLDAVFTFDVYDDYRTFGAYRLFMGWDALGFLCQRADLVSYASRTMAARHAFGNPCIVVPNGIDAATFAPKPMAEARSSAGLPADCRLVGYFGSMTAEHGVDTLLHAMTILRRRKPDVRLVICGKPDPTTVLAGDGVIYRGLVPHAEMPSYLNACDVLALPYARGTFIDNASSCKIAEYLACRRPIAATRTPNFVENFPEQASQLDALLVPPGDAEALARTIGRQLDDPVVAGLPACITWTQVSAALLAEIERLVH